VFYLRNHDVLFETLVNGSRGDVDDIHSDFYITLNTLDVVDAMLEEQFALYGLSNADLLTKTAEQLYHLNARTAEWREPLCYYSSIVAFLRAQILASGPLICGWSA